MATTHTQLMTTNTYLVPQYTNLWQSFELTTSKPEIVTLALWEHVEQVKMYRDKTVIQFKRGGTLEDVSKYFALLLSPTYLENVDFTLKQL